MAGKISDLTNMNGAATIDRAADFMEITDTSAGVSYKATPNFILGLASAPLGTTDSQSPTNKTFDNSNILTLRDDRFTLQDNSDTTKQAKFELSGITTATTRTYTLPNASGTLVDLASSQTLTNKTLTSPTINTATISNPTLTINTISEHTAANGVTIDGLNIKDNKLNTNNSVVTANITNAAVTADKLGTGAASSRVATSETTTSTTFAALATAQAVPVTIGANGLALVCLRFTGGNSGADAQTAMSFSVSGATTQAASASYEIRSRQSTATAQQSVGITLLLTGLTPGATTFTALFSVTSGTGTFLNREIAVVPL